MARSKISPEIMKSRLLFVMLIFGARILPAAGAIENTTLSEISSSTVRQETSSSSPASETTSTSSSFSDTVSSISQTALTGIQTIIYNNFTVSTTSSTEQTTPDSEQKLSVTPHYLTLFVGMRTGTQLNVNISAPNISQLVLTDSNGTDVFALEGGKIVLNQTLTRESSYTVSIKAQNDSVRLVVRVERLKFEQPIYMAAVPENKEARQCILDINSNAEHHGVPVVYSLASGHSMFSINSSTGVVCVEGAVDGEVRSEHLLNVSLHIDEVYLVYGKQSGNETDRAGIFDSFEVSIRGRNDQSPSFGKIGRGLILSVPEHVNESYIIVSLKEGSNILVQYSLTNDSSDTFFINDGQLQVKAPEQLKGRHVFKVTVKAEYMNRTSNAAYLDIKIFVVEDENDFILPTQLTAATLRQNCVYFIEELGTILGWRLNLVKVEEHKPIDASDSDRSELVFKAFEINTNDSIHVSDIGKHLAEKSQAVASMFGYFSRFLNSTSDETQYMLNSASDETLSSDNSQYMLNSTSDETLSSDNSQYMLNSLSKILIAVACLLLLVLIAVAVVVCRRRWRSCCTQKDYLSDEDHLSKNWYLSKDNHGSSSHVSETLESTDKSEFTMETSKSDFFSNNQSMFTRFDQPDKTLMVETTQDTFPFDVETRSLGLNTVARREHSRDQQMEKLQLLFQAMNDAILYSKDNLYPKVDTEEHEGDSLPPIERHDNSALVSSSEAPESALTSAALTESSELVKSMPNTVDSVSSGIPSYRGILPDESGKLDPEAHFINGSSQKSVTSELDTDNSHVGLSQISNSAFSKRQSPFEDNNTPHQGPSVTDSNGDFILGHTDDQNKPLPLEYPLTSEHDTPGSVALHSTDIDVSTEHAENTTNNSQWLFPLESQNLDSPLEDVQDQNVSVVSTEDVVTHFQTQTISTEDVITHF